MAPTSLAQSVQTRANLGFVARLAGTAVVLGCLVARVSPKSIVVALRSLPSSCLLSAFALVLLAALVALVRWRALLRAYGASTLPAPLESASIFGGALFYNLLPGAIGGDVYRGYATRHCFADAAVARSVGVVFIDRVLGLAGLFALLGLAVLLTGRVEREFLTFAGLGMAAAIGVVLGFSSGRRLAPWLPGRLATWAQRLPEVASNGYLWAAIALSLGTHSLLSLAGHVLIRSLAPEIQIADSLVTFPLGTLASYFPFTVAGAGARDGALAFLFGKLGVARPTILAVSLCLLSCDLLVCTLGGLLHATTTGRRARLHHCPGCAGSDSQTELQLRPHETGSIFRNQL
jgi:glycosyltransferase 2 family protein